MFNKRLMTALVLGGLMFLLVAGGSALAKGGGGGGGHRGGGGTTTPTGTITVSPNPVPLNSTTITINGTGFGANQQLLVASGSCCLSSATADSSGNLSVLYTPAMGFYWPGTFSAQVFSSSGSLLASVTFTVK